MAELNAATALFGGGAGLPLGDILAYHAARDPHRAALVHGEERLSFADLDARANRRARALAARGVGQGDFVTLALPNGPEYYETTFALWKLGAVPNPVSHRLPRAEFEAIVGLVRPRLVIGAALGVNEVLTLPGDAPVDETLSADPLETRVSPYWKALTSGGSTGRPKIIVDSMPGRWDPAQTAFGQRPGMTLLNPGPLYHNAPFALVHLALFIGATIVEMGRFDAERALALIDQHRVNWVNFVPTMMHRIWRLDGGIRAAYRLDSLECVVHMAAACPAWLKEAWIDWIGPDRLFEVYAGTERQGATWISGREWLSHRGSVGRPQPGTQIRVLDAEGRELPPGEIGEIYFLPDGGAGSTYHYIGAQPDRLGDWETLGDLGWFDEEGYLYLADRRKDLIISGGANIYPAEVEAALDSHEAVMSSAVVGVPDEEWGHRPHAFVQLRPGARLSAQDLQEFVGGLLARHKIPKTIAFVDHPLRDDAGKVRRSELWKAGD